MAPKQTIFLTCAEAPPNFMSDETTVMYPIHNTYILFPEHLAALGRVMALWCARAHVFLSYFGVSTIRMVIQWELPYCTSHVPMEILKCM